MEPVIKNRSKAREFWHELTAKAAELEITPPVVLLLEDNKLNLHIYPGIKDVLDAVSKETDMKFVAMSTDEQIIIKLL